MNERILDRSPLRSPVALPSVLGIVALSILSATPPVGASGGNIDNDSPYNMPTFGDSSGNGGGSGSSSGGGAKVYWPGAADRAEGIAAGTLAKLVPIVEVGGSFSVVEKLASTAFAVVPGAKIAAPGVGNPSGPAITVQVAAGEHVSARDSAPIDGDDTVEIQGSFVVRGAHQLVVSPNKQLIAATAFLLLGDSGDSPTGIMAQIDQIVPLGPSGSSVDIAEIAGGLAKVPHLLGRDAQVIVGHKKWTPGVGVAFHVDASVDFQIAVRPTFEVDTDPDFDD